eukprot:gene7953-9448_t
MVAVYSDTNGGVGPGSAKWTQAFFSWWTDLNPELRVAYITNAKQLDDCDSLKAYSKLQLWVQPGGNAEEQSAALGPGGRDNVLDFAASSHGHVYATCAGWYYSAGSYWWYGDFI